MISSLMSRMAQAQNLDVNQLKQAVQDGTLPAYVGVPLIQDKMKQQQMAQSDKPQPAQRPIADQILAQAVQKGIDSAPSNLQSMSGGGIAYAAGGDVDQEDYEDVLQEQQDEQDMELAQMAGQNTGMAGQNFGQGIAIAASTPQVSKQPTSVNQTPNVEQGIKQITDKDQARKYNVGNLRPSGFTYKGQIGVSPGGFAMFDSEEAGHAALDQDINAKLKRGVDTPEKFIEIYAPRKSHGGDNPDKTVDAYIDNVAKSLGIERGGKIPNTPEARQALHDAIIKQEGSQYATAHFAEGGIASIRHFATGDAVNFGVKDPSTWEDEKDAPNFGVKDPSTWNNDATPNTMKDLMSGPATITPPVQLPVQTPAAPSAWDKYLSGLNQSREDLKNQKSEDKYMSLMAAGLGILKSSGEVAPGKVHTALGDIASGGLEGVAYAQQAAKQRAAQENALNKEAGTALYRNYLTNASKENQTANLDIKNRQLNETEREHQMLDRNRQEAGFRDWQKIITAPLDKKIAAAITDEDKQKYELEKQDTLYNHPVFREQWKKLYPDLPLPIVQGEAGWYIKPRG
jgi:hypothetical protein